MFTTDVWLLVTASAAVLLATKVLVHTRFSIVALTKTILDGIGEVLFQRVFGNKCLL